MNTRLLRPVLALAILAAPVTGLAACGYQPQCDDVAQGAVLADDDDCGGDDD